MDEPAPASNRQGKAAYFPFIIKARLVKQLAMGTYRAVLVSDCVSIGPIHYSYAFYVREHGDTDPVLCVASEIADQDPDQAGRFLCTFHEGIHSNFGFSSEWLDMGKFTEAAVAIAAQHLGIAGQPEELPLGTAPGFRLRFLPPWGK